MNFEKLFRKHIWNLKPYSSARDEYTGSEGIFLDANENPLGSVAKGSYNRYPDPYQREIKAKLSQLKKVTENQIFLGNGSDEPIDLIIQATCTPLEDEMIILPPTYGMYQVCADIHQAKVISVNLTADFKIDKVGLENAITQNTKLVWFCTPNNPSGNDLDTQVILDFVKKHSEVLFVIDEAYIDFSENESFIEKITTFENILVLQTFSKAWGMAGLRVGVAYAHEKIIAILNKIKYPYNLNIATQRIVLEALDNVAQKESFVKEIIANRSKLEQELSELQEVKHIFPSDSNQLLVKFDNAGLIFKMLLEQKVIVRDRSKVILCENCLRISIGTEAENAEFLKTLKEVLKTAPIAPVVQ